MRCSPRQKYRTEEICGPWAVSCRCGLWAVKLNKNSKKVCYRENDFYMNYKHNYGDRREKTGVVGVPSTIFVPAIIHHSIFRSCTLLRMMDNYYIFNSVQGFP